MKITVTITKAGVSESPFVSTFTDSYLAQLFIKALLDDAYESGKVTFEVDVTFPEAAGEN